MKSPRRAVLLSAAAAAPLLVLGTWSGLAGASGTAGHPLSVLPNPAVVGDRLIAGGGQSPETACDGDRVALAVARDGAQVFAQDAQPNGTGGWSIELPRLEAATYEVTATCERAGAQVFAYDPTALLVRAQAQPTTQPTAQPTTPPTAPPASPVPGAPTFTG